MIGLFKICKNCKLKKPIEEFYIHKKMKDGHLSFCKECVKNRISDYYHKNAIAMREKERLRYQKRKTNPEYKKRTLLYQRKWRTSKILKAHNTVERKLKKFKPDRCTICNRKSKLIQAHHPDYNYPEKIIWCCPVCHRQFCNKRLTMGEIYGL